MKDSKTLLFVLQFIFMYNVYSVGKDTLSPKSDTLFSNFLRKNYQVIENGKIDSMSIFDTLYPFDAVFYNKRKAMRSIRFKTDASCIYVDSVFRINDCLMISGKHLGFARHDFILMHDLNLKKNEIYFLIPQEISLIEKIHLIRIRMNW